MTENLIMLKKYVDGEKIDSRYQFPPAIAKTLGYRLIEINEANACVELKTDTKIHGNPMGTLHGGVLGDLADFAIGTAHVTTLESDESFTSVDLQINFFRPVWNARLVANAIAVQKGKTLSRYVCDILNEESKLVAQVTSTVMTLRGEKAAGR